MGYGIVGEAKMKCHVITYAKAANLLVEITKHVFQRIGNLFALACRALCEYTKFKLYTMIKIQNGISYIIDIAMAHQIVLTAQMNTKNVYVTKVKIKS